MMMARPRIIGVGGFSSDTGKTTLVCELLRAFPGWEAIKTTRGHYRSCGKDPHTCCVSHLLGEEARLLSGRDQTYAIGKDTGRYWDAGAANVHWLIGTDEQIEEGIKRAIDRVTSRGVFVEGNSFSEYVHVDAMILTVREGSQQVKRSAKRALMKASALYVLPEPNFNRHPTEIVASLIKGDERLLTRVSSIPCYTADSFSDLVISLQKLHHSVAA